MKKSYSLLVNGLVSIALIIFTTSIFAASDSANYTAAPPFVATNIGKPNVVVALDISGSMKAVAYADLGAGSWKKGLHDDFNQSASYFGYFDSNKSYSYSPSLNKQFFYEDNGGLWNGNFLNWLTMRRMDVVRKVLTGGKVNNRNGESIDGERWFILDGQNEPLDYTFRKSYSRSAEVSPITNSSEVLIANGAFSLTTGEAASITQLSDNVEIGQISIDRDIRDAAGDWYSVNFKNTYAAIPSVVATALSFNGSQPSLARVKDITKTGFKVRIDEWDYLDGNHTTEDVVFIVAATGNHKVSIKDKDTDITSSYQVSAGTVTVTANAAAFNNISAGSTFSTIPVVFAGTSSLNDPMPVTTRIRNISAGGFDLALQEERSQIGGGHSAELVSWIAIEPLVGFSEYAGVAIEINKTSNLHSEAWRDITLTPDLFAEIPMVAVGLQTFNGSDPVVARYGNAGVTTDKFDVKMEEENSSGDNDLEHGGLESVGYIAVEASRGFKIRIGLKNEPTGIIQQNSGSVRFGLAVYNYDHSLSPTSIYKNNKIHGGTLRPCYPDITKDVADQSNFDICLDTHVKSPLTNIIEVIDDHPLIWGTTPIAETLYDIQGYFKQENYGNNGHNQYYDNGTEGLSGNASDGEAKSRSSYDINQDWDPYFYEEFDAYLPCAKSFVLHFNDGAPYKDFDGTGHPNVSNDGVGSFGTEQMLDDLALELRQEDCRDDNGLTGHQDIVSYYVYAALGQEEFSDGDGSSINRDDNVLRMREAAANGGFVDNNGNNQPDPAHPSDFFNYVVNGAGNCTPNEWDEDGDCNPDTFYYASDAEALVSQLNAALESITARSGSGGAASVIAASRSGEGAVFNAIFRPSVTSAGQEVTWIGDVHALMIDSSGNIRQDNGDGILGASNVDQYIDMCSYDDGELKEVRIKLSTSLATRPIRSQFSECAKAVFNKDLFDLNYLWSGANWLSSLSDDEATAQRTYTSTTLGRHIISGIDVDDNGLITKSEVVDFLPDSFDDSTAGLLAGTLDDARNVVSFIRGQDIDGYRSRQLNGKTMRLGDVIYSTPTVVGRPAENLDLIYGSTSYQKFFDHYRYRRQVVYAGGNDGMLHAFNSGWFDPKTKEFKKSKGGGNAGSSIDFDLGAELWAYAPYNTLGHLEYLTRPSYGAVSSDHLYFVDLEPRIFDAKIFPSDSNHPGGWGTVMVVGSRLGGGLKNVDMDLGAATANRTLRSSITIFDITNPDIAPKMLLEFTDPQLGFTTAIPAPVVVGQDSEGNGDWYLLLGSGADETSDGFDEVKSTQKATLFLLDLKEIALGNTNVLETAFGGGDGKVQLTDDNSFISDLSAVDFGLDKFTTDAVYFGTVSGDKNGWGGKVYRILIQEKTNGAQKAVSSWQIAEVINPNRPVTAPVSMATDNLRNRWLHFGTGRFFTQEDNLDNSQNYFYGLKETRSSSGEFTYIKPTKIVDVTSTQVRSDNAKVEQAPTLTPPLGDGATIHTLESRMKNYGGVTDVDGWFRTLAAGEKNFGAATIFGGTLTFTTFDPEFDECSVDGDARLYVLNALTGTAGSPGILAQDDNNEFNNYVIDLGSSPATSPSIHVGDGYSSDNKANAVIQTSDGAITTVEQKNQENVRSGEVSWRELQ